MKKIFLVAAVLSSSLMFAQGFKNFRENVKENFSEIGQNKTLTERGDDLVAKYELTEAIKLYEAALEKDQTNVYAMLQVAKCYRMQNNIPKAAYWYERSVFAADSEPINKYYYAEVLRQMGQYEKSIKFYEEFSKWYPEDKRAELGINSAKNALSIKGRPAIYSIQNRKELNSGANEFSPVVTDNQMTFSSDRNAPYKINYEYGYTGQGYLDTYNAEKNENGEFASIRIGDGKTNSLYHDANYVVSRKGNLAAFSRNQYKQNIIGGNVKKAESDDVVKLKIMLAEKDAETGEFGKFFEASFNDAEYSFSHPAFSLDGKKLIFASDMPGGYGGIDIWTAVIKSDGTFETPINAGLEINTAADEMYPYVSNDGALYFSSNGLPGLGGLDIFRAELSATDRYENPYNLGSPINSSMDDFSFYYDNFNTSGYFASNRLGGLGGDDIYSAKIIGLFSNIEVVDASTQLLMPNTEVCIWVNGNEIARATTSSKGSIFMPLSVNQKYTVSVCDGSYQAKDNEINTYGKVPGEYLNETVYVYPKGDAYVSGLVLEQNSNLPVGNSKVTLINGNTGETKTVESDQYGFYRFEIFPGVEQYLLSAEKEGYTGEEAEFDTKEMGVDEEIKQNLILSGGEVICNVAFNNIYFDLNKANLREESIGDLEKMLQILTLSESVKVEIAAHTDSRGSDAYNMNLSEKRALSVLAWLKEKGVSSDRLKYKGYGETELLNACGNDAECSEEEHQKNRRVEFKVLNAKGEVLCKSRRK